MKDLIVISLIIFVIYIIIKNKNKNTSKINSSNYKNKDDKSSYITPEKIIDATIIEKPIYKQNIQDKKRDIIEIDNRANRSNHNYFNTKKQEQDKSIQRKDIVEIDRIKNKNCNDYLKNNYDIESKILEKQQEEYGKDVKESKFAYGKNYEEFICKFYEQKGYIVEWIGTKNSKLTNEKVDIVAKRDDKITLIECKYWTNKIIEYNDINNIFGKYNFFINENKLNKDKTNLTIVFPKLENLTKSAKDLLTKHKDILRYEVVPLIKNKFKLILGIIEAENKCYKPCYKNTPVIALKFYNSYDFAEIEDKIVYYLFEELPEDLLNKIQEKYSQYKSTTRRDDFCYIANNCIHCKRIQDDKHLYDKKEGVFYNVDDLEPKYYIAYNENTETLEYISEFYN